MRRVAIKTALQSDRSVRLYFHCHQPEKGTSTSMIHSRFPMDAWIHFCQGYFEAWCFVKIIADDDWRFVYFECPLEYPVKNLPVSTRERQLVRSNNAAHFDVCYWYVFVTIKNQFWDTYFFYFGYLSSGQSIASWREKDGEDRWLLFEARRDRRAKRFGKRCNTEIAWRLDSPQVKVDAFRVNPLTATKFGGASEKYQGEF
jgi:hypothetical protein